MKIYLAKQRDTEIIFYKNAEGVIQMDKVTRMIFPHKLTMPKKSHTLVYLPWRLSGADRRCRYTCGASP